MGTMYSLPSRAQAEFFHEYVGIAARLGYSLTASPPRYGVRSAARDFAKAVTFCAMVVIRMKSVRSLPAIIVASLAA
jgi:hypothetical protein